MEVNTMISNGTAWLRKPTRKVITEPITRRKGLSTKCVVEILNEDGTTDRTFNSISEAAKVFTNNSSSTAYIYRMVAHGKARLVYREEEEKFYNALEHQEWEEEEERFYDALEHQEWEGTLKLPNEFFKIISLMVKTLING